MAVSITAGPGLSKLLAVALSRHDIIQKYVIDTLMVAGVDLLPIDDTVARARLAGRRFIISPDDFVMRVRHYLHFMRFRFHQSP